MTVGPQSATIKTGDRSSSHATKTTWKQLPIGNLRSGTPNPPLLHHLGLTGGGPNDLSAEKITALFKQNR